MSEDKKTKNKKKEVKKPNQEDQLKEMEHNYKKALADYQNLVKRTAQEKAEYVKYANEQLIMEFVPVYDNLKISLEHIGEEDKENPWVKGIEYVIKMFADLLESNGVKEIKTLGEKFDPHTMEAMQGQGDKVTKEVSAGYMLNDKVIKPAKVIVNDESSN
ncbi:nucleotide exchange factor GrpE [Candidatus Falkowbacteria bacterium]|nr:nucleotide exchange factor GrpE [Candidatus Falkowbacteria bacterium]